MSEPLCRSCGAPLRDTFIDLGMSPFSNSYIRVQDAQQMEPFFPLHAYVCGSCFLVQLKEFESPQDIFSDYAYFSSYSDSWVAHCKAYVDYVMQRFGLGGGHLVVEVASNDGYLLKFFREKSVPVLGIEPAANVAAVAQAAGIPTLVKFFSVDTAPELVPDGKCADLLLGNNVLAHVPDLNDFVRGIAILLKASGVATFEFPHLLRLIKENQFDTIYHEHFSYFSFITAEQVFARHGLQLFDVEELLTHGGSLRIFAQHVGAPHPLSPRVAELRDRETRLGLLRMETYAAFTEQVKETKRNLLSFLIGEKRAGKSIVGYGAPAKGNTLLNYCGIRDDFLDYTVDRSPHKQGMLLPGTRIRVFAPEKIRETKPDYVFILPWNIRDEVMEQMRHIREWGGKFVLAIPTVKMVG